MKFGKSKRKITILCIQRIGTDSRKYIEILAKLPHVEKVIEANFHFRVGTVQENKHYLANLPDSHRQYYLDNKVDPDYFVDQSVTELADHYLSQVDMIYIPGAAFDPLAEFCVDKPKAISPDTRRELFELQIIERAKKLGLPILAVCAGSWRLANAYGGMTEALTNEDVNKHEKWGSIREMTESVEIKPGTMFHSIHLVAQRDRSIQKDKKELAITLDKYHDFESTELKVNSSHGRVVRAPELQTNSDFHRLFQMSAIDKQTKTVEAFESKHGVPMIGVQFHPEYSIPFFKRANTVEVVQGYKTHRMLLETSVEAAQTYSHKKSMLREVKKP